MKESAERKKEYEKLTNLRKDIKDGRAKLKIGLYGDVQRTKNVLQNHKDLQRLYQNMPASVIVENMDQRTFVKRKELDRLVCKKKQLTEKYEEIIVSIVTFLIHFDCPRPPL